MSASGRCNDISHQEVKTEAVSNTDEAEERAECEAFARCEIGGTISTLHAIEGERDDRNVIEECEQNNFHRCERKSFDD